MLLAAWGLRSEIPAAVWALSLLFYGMYGMVAYFSDDREDLFTTTGMVVGLVEIVAIGTASIYAVVVS